MSKFLEPDLSQNSTMATSQADNGSDSATCVKVVFSSSVGSSPSGVSKAPESLLAALISGTFFVVTPVSARNSLFKGAPDRSLDSDLGTGISWCSLPMLAAG